MPMTRWIVIFGAWAGLGLVFVGIGSLFRRVLRGPARDAEDLLLSFWLGWICVLFFLQIWHLFLPIGPQTIVAVAAFGAIGLAAGGIRAWRSLVRGAAANPLLIVLGLLAFVWVANRAQSAALFGDTGGYYIPTVRWLVEHPIVPGLANLYVPFGFNQSYFLYVAMIDVGPFLQVSHRIANSLLICALVARVLLATYRIFRWRRSCAPEDVLYALLLPLTVGLVTSIFVASPAPDAIVTVLGAVLAGELVAFLSRPGSRLADRFRLFAVVLIAAGGVTVKLSFAAMGATAALIAVSVWWARARRAGQQALGATVLAGLIATAGLGPWIVRNAILSGCPFYPSCMAELPVEWRIYDDPQEWVQGRLNLAPPLTWLRDPAGFAHRYGWLTRDVLLSLGAAGAAAVGGLLALGVRAGRRNQARRRASPLILLPTLASLCFTLETTPQPRYAGAAIWLIGAQAVLLALGGSILEARRWQRVAIGASVLVVSSLLLADADALWNRDVGSGHLPAAVYEPTRLVTGLVVNVPTNRRCLAAPLPCTPEPNQALRLRKPGDLASGFLIDPAIYADQQSQASRQWVVARKGVYEAGGLTVRLNEGGKVFVQGVDRWGEPREMRFQDATYFRNAVETLRRSFNEEQQAALDAALASLSPAEEPE